MVARQTYAGNIESPVGMPKVSKNANGSVTIRFNKPNTDASGMSFSSSGKTGSGRFLRNTESGLDKLVPNRYGGPKRPAFCL